MWKSLRQGLSSAEIYANSHEVAHGAEQICPVCSGTRKLQQCHADPEKDILALGRHQETGPLLDTLIFCASPTAHCLSVLLESGQPVQQDWAKTAEGITRVKRRCRPGLTGTRAERLLPLQRHWPVLFHLFPEKEKLFVYAYESSTLGKANFTLKHSTCRPAGHGNRDNGGNKCYFLPELDLTARKKTIFKLYQENKPQLVLVSGMIACSSQGSLVHGVHVYSKHLFPCWIMLPAKSRSEKIDA